MSDENQILLEKLKKYLSVSVCQERYEHSMRTAQTAKELCLRFGEDSELGEIAGVAHDICKEMKKNLLFLLVEQDGMEISQIERDKPSLLHGRAASVVLKNEFGVTNKDVLEAVANHTFGKPKMCNLAKILYVSDKIEPGRPQVTQEYLEKLEKKSLNELVSFVLEENIDYLNKKGKSVSEITYKFLESVKEGEC